eukprot:559072-Rhodomonas_salina.1
MRVKRYTWAAVVGIPTGDLLFHPSRAVARLTHAQRGTRLVGGRTTTLATLLEVDLGRSSPMIGPVEPADRIPWSHRREEAVSHII